MVSKKQKLARMRFKEANPELFPIPEAPTESPTSKKKKSKKPKTLKPKPNSNKKKSGYGSKHPLRVPGMRPGESCFICKSTDHIAKLCPQKSQWEKNKICLLCRHRGHSLKNCRQKSENETVDKKLCYNCGQSGHALSKCPRPLQDGGTKFANCFICNERGHLSKNCPKNTHGIYPKGGCCKICGGVTHLAKDCPNKGIKNSLSSAGQNGLGNLEGSAQGKRTVFHSGDDLEDDFMIEDEKDSKIAVSNSNSGPTTVQGNAEQQVGTASSADPRNESQEYSAMLKPWFMRHHALQRVILEGMFPDVVSNPVLPD